MFPIINRKESGVNLRRLMDARGITTKEVQEYLGLGCIQSVYRWLEGKSMPSIDHLYALSKWFGVSIDEMVCGNVEVYSNDRVAAWLAQSRRLYEFCKIASKYMAA